MFDVRKPSIDEVRESILQNVGYTAGGNAYPWRPPFALRAEPSLR